MMVTPPEAFKVEGRPLQGGCQTVLKGGSVNKTNPAPFIISYQKGDHTE